MDDGRNWMQNPNRGSKRSWAFWPSAWWTSGQASNCGSSKAGTRIIDTRPTRSTTRAELSTSPPAIGINQNMASWLGLQLKPASIGFTTSPDLMSTARLSQVSLISSRLVLSCCCCWCFCCFGLGCFGLDWLGLAFIAWLCFGSQSFMASFVGLRRQTNTNSHRVSLVLCSSICF